MRLRYHPASPFVRKVVVAASELGLLDRIEMVATRTRPPLSPDLGDDNPLGKVPALVTDDGVRLYDSGVICEYLDWLAGNQRLFPPPGPARWEALRLATLGDGMIGTLEGRLPPEDHTAASIAHQLAKLAVVLDTLDAWPGGLGPDPTIGTISVAAALGYLDWRLPEEDWHAGRLALSAWYGAFAARPSMRESAPRGEPA